MAHMRQHCRERHISRSERTQSILRSSEVEIPGIGFGRQSVQFAGRERLVSAENERFARLADVQLRRRKVLRHRVVLREGRRHEGLRRDDEVLDPHAAALRGVAAGAGLFDRVSTHPALLVELVEQRLLLLHRFFARLFVEKRAERQRREVDIVQIVSGNNRHFRGVDVGRKIAHLHRRVASTLENEEIAHVAAMADAATHRTGFGLDRGVARNEQNRDFDQRNRGIIAEREVLGSQLAKQRLVGNVPIVEEVEEHGSLRSREEENEIVLVSIDRAE